MHLLQSGVSLEIIRDFLGDVDVKTTQIYARAALYPPKSLNILALPVYPGRCRRKTRSSEPSPRCGMRWTTAGPCPGRSAVNQLAAGAA